LSYRVLIVEDHERWRRHVRSVLERTPPWEIVAEAADGLEAVHTVDSLKPDLILMDIGLPGLDGIGAARRILADHPGSRILFLSEHQSSDVVQAALGTGARGYITKSDAGRDLLPAMEAIVEGRWFVGARFGGRIVDGATNDPAAARELRRHEAGLYSDEASLIDEYARFAEAALRNGTTLIAVLPDPRREVLHQRLQARGIDVNSATRAGTYLALEVPATLSRFIVDGRLDEARFWNAASGLVVAGARATDGKRPRVALCGDGAATLLREGLVDAATSLERLWDQMARTFDLDVFCPYLVEDLRCDDQNPVFQRICAAHSAVHVRTR
jgi:DNA-binding NarL/FixJ family response regulator